MLEADFEIENGVLEKYSGWDRDVVIPEGVKAIGMYALQNRSSITSWRLK